LISIKEKSSFWQNSSFSSNINWENLNDFSTSQFNYQEKTKRQCYLFAKKQNRPFVFQERQLETTKPGTYLLEEFSRIQILSKKENEKNLKKDLEDAFTIDPGAV
jgi:hypothetical protein